MDTTKPKNTIVNTLKWNYVSHTNKYLNKKTDRTYRPLY